MFSFARAQYLFLQAGVIEAPVAPATVLLVVVMKVVLPFPLAPPIGNVPLKVLPAGAVQDGYALLLGIDVAGVDVVLNACTSAPAGGPDGAPLPGATVTVIVLVKTVVSVVHAGAAQAPLASSTPADDPKKAPGLPEGVPDGDPIGGTVIVSVTVRVPVVIVVVESSALVGAASSTCGLALAAKAPGSGPPVGGTKVVCDLG